MSIFGWQVLNEEDKVEVPDEAPEEVVDTSIEEEPEEETPEEEPEDNEDDTEEEPEEDDSIEDDFTLDGDSDDLDDSTESETGSSEGDSSDMDIDPDTADGRIKALQDEVDSELSEPEKQNRDKTLKKQYAELYNTTSGILLSLNRALRTPDNVSVINFIEERLGELNTRISDYLLDVYSSKSYVQNLSMYYSMLDIFTNMEKLLTSSYNNKVNQEI